jgi:hypothetical protein
MCQFCKGFPDKTLYGIWLNLILFIDNLKSNSQTKYYIMLLTSSILNYPTGTIQLLLEKSYQPFHEQFPEYLEENTRSFNECDTFFYSNPEIANKCSFISVYEGHLVGMACWDPRNHPSATIGHNCILPAFQGLGFGKEQMGLVICLLR